MQVFIRGFTFVLPVLEKERKYDFKAQDGNDYAILTIDLSKKTISLFSKRGSVSESIKLFFSTTWFLMKHYSGKSFMSRSNSFSRGTRATTDDLDLSRILYEEKVEASDVQDLIDLYHRLLVV